SIWPPIPQTAVDAARFVAPVRCAAEGSAIADCWVRHVSQARCAAAYPGCNRVSLQTARCAHVVSNRACAQRARSVAQDPMAPDAATLPQTNNTAEAATLPVALGPSVSMAGAKRAVARLVRVCVGVVVWTCRPRGNTVVVAVCPALQVRCARTGGAQRAEIGRAHV